MSRYTASVNQDRAALRQHRRDLDARRKHAAAIEVAAAGTSTASPALVATTDLVKGDMVAFEGDWHAVVEIECGASEWKLDLGDIFVTVSIDAEWRTKQ